MKKLLILLFVTALTYALNSCQNEPIETYATENPEVQVHKMFSVEGHNVYRFKDEGRNHYIVIGSNQVINTQLNSAGKTLTYVDESIFTIKLDSVSRVNPHFKNLTTGQLLELSRQSDSVVSAAIRQLEKDNALMNHSEIK